MLSSEWEGWAQPCLFHMTGHYACEILAMQNNAASMLQQNIDKWNVINSLLSTVHSIQTTNSATYVQNNSNLAAVSFTEFVIVYRNYS